MLKTSCGRTSSNSGKPFIPESLAQHERDCKVCNETAYLDDLPIADDEPDGVYWAMVAECEGLI